MSSHKHQHEHNAYYSSYEDISVHDLMLKDKPRTLAYMHAIEQNVSLFENKVVMDVGAGTGILSLFAAKYGKAKKVFAVEASNMAHVADAIVRQNGLEHVISVVHGPVEALEMNNADNQQVIDVIISEWMGFYLVHESMLESVIYARDKFLKPSGTLFPNFAKIYAAPVSLTHVFEEEQKKWSNIYGFDMSPVAEMVVAGMQEKPFVEVIAKDALLAEPALLSEINLQTVKHFHHMKFDHQFVISKEGSLHGLCVWFDVIFKGPSATVTLATGPMDEPTHWKQTTVVLPRGIHVQKDSQIPKCKIGLNKKKDSARQYTISVTWDVEDDDDDAQIQEEEEVANEYEEDAGDMEEADDGEDSDKEHDPDCKCSKCALLRACLEKY